ncbi:DUF2586 family protein [Ornithobacterium rhinotracheale]|uniref:DUF2586 family protein n=1 Tax=Ornithobacterium rhinotracheale TaxID=28251 RepID=UPI001FF113A7|nr:DUF2586 family protein [Ornithobacterium rhinotracheale]MCK0199231.1 DUF2586 family protein [Ornithobacterium rhinotracheale]MCK0200260.1 DUF2586 family protein [Ornithobacterium rhinotracheale]MCK0200544.1 DUF2586 family protein [Ornithobacterium rhinotracheale]
MANLKGVDIQKGKIGANRLSSNDAVSGLILSAVKPEHVELDKPTTLFNLKDVLALGITPEFDKTNNCNVYRHCSEFFAMAGEGTPLHLLLVSNATKMVDMVDTKAKKLLAYARGEIRQLAVGVNPTSAPDSMLNGLPADVYNSIAKAQALYNWAYENHMPCQIFLEGHHYSGTASSSANLREIEDLQADKVSVVIGQDWLHAEALTGEAQKYADVGTALGTCSRAKVQENIGDNGQFNLTDATASRWIEPGLSSHQTNAEAYEDLQTLERKGYIFGVTYAGLAGVRWNNDHTCTPIIVDADNSMNEHSIAYGRVTDKAVRELRKAYLPIIKTTWQVDKSTGKLNKGTLVALEDVGDKVFEDMILRGEITYGRTYIDADSDLLVERVLKVSYKIVPKGVIGEIRGTINLKTRD